MGIEETHEYMRRAVETDGLGRLERLLAEARRLNDVLRCHPDADERFLAAIGVEDARKVFQRAVIGVAPELIQVAREASHAAAELQDLELEVTDGTYVALEEALAALARKLDGPPEAREEES